jgi:hypothetical protein
MSNGYSVCAVRNGKRYHDKPSSRHVKNRTVLPLVRIVPVDQSVPDPCFE